MLLRIVRTAAVFAAGVAFGATLDETQREQVKKTKEQLKQALNIK